MKVFLNIILIVFFLSLFTNNIFAQDSLQADKMKRNHIKVGTTSFIKYHLSYEHAVAKHFSAGIMASYSATTFIGYTGTVFARYYFNPFDKSGWFLEVKGSYACFTPTAYSDRYKPRPEAAAIYSGEHQGNVKYLYAGISGGYKVFLSKRIVFESLLGLHYGEVTFQENDKYIVISPNVYGPPINEAFYLTGPGFPIHIMVNFGFAF